MTEASDLSKLSRVVWLVPAAIAAISVMPLSDAYFVFARFEVFASCALLSWISFNDGPRNMPWVIALGLAALAFNPSFSIDRPATMVGVIINSGTVLLLLLHMVRFKGS